MRDREQTKAADYLDRFAIKIRDTVLLILTKNVTRIESAGVYVTIYAGGNPMLYRSSLSQLERSLDPKHFLRIHRTAIVNIDCIVQLKVLTHGEFDAVLADGSRLRVSRTYRDAMEKRLRQRL